MPQSPAVESTSIAGPGFVNFMLSNDWLADRVDAMLRDGISTWAPLLPVRYRQLPDCKLARSLCCSRFDAWAQQKGWFAEVIS